MTRQINVRHLSYNELQKLSSEEAKALGKPYPQGANHSELCEFLDHRGYDVSIVNHLNRGKRQ